MLLNIFFQRTARLPTLFWYVVIGRIENRKAFLALYKINCLFKKISYEIETVLLKQKVALFDDNAGSPGMFSSFEKGITQLIKNLSF